MKSFLTLAAFVVGTISGQEGSEPLAPITRKVFMDIEIGGEAAGRIVYGLYGDVVPKTTENFAEICKGDHFSKHLKKNLTYEKSPFHRIIPGFMAQGGDITKGNGQGGESIYGKKFADENFDISFEKPYLLAMANSGKNTNGSQFFITFEVTSWLNGHHVVFGEVVEGFELVDEMEKQGS